MTQRSYTVPFLVIGGIFIFFTLLFLGIAFIFGTPASLTLGARIGVIEIIGPITTSDRTVQTIVDFRLNDAIKGVILRVDSPGGGVGPSQEIYAEIKRLAAKKPVIVSMGGVAASGGYYVSLPAQKILANPGTLTGSIGVIMGFTNYQDLFEKIGLKSDVVKSGEHKDIGSAIRPMTETDRSILQELIDDVHNQFVTAVAEERSLEFEVAAQLADGRVYTGRQAMESGLIDELGNFRDAVALVAAMTSIDGEPTLVYPAEPKKNFVDYFIEQSVDQFRKGLREEGSAGLQYRWNADRR
ncbi:MAG: signal peptide peptidase SppA [Desulfuromonadales bacterium]|nr:signal peptide peptidase SppA [Desulfuromonadales bacterium]